MNAASGSGLLCVVTRRDLGGVVLRRDQVIADVGEPGSGYRIYSNHGAGAVDFDTPEARVSANVRHWTRGGLRHPGTWRFVVRAYNRAGSEWNLDRQALLEIDADGRPVFARPGHVTGLSGRAKPAGKVELSFTYEETQGEPEVTHFHVYHDDGTGRIDEETVALEIPRSAGRRTHYVWETPGLTDGKTYLLAVKTVTDQGVEGLIRETVVVTADAASPQQVSPTPVASVLH